MSLDASRPSRTIHVWLRVIANDGGIDEHSEKLVLVVGGVVLEDSGGVWVVLATMELWPVKAGGTIQ